MCERGLGGPSPPATLPATPRRRHPQTVSAREWQPVIAREEVVATLFNLADIAVEVRRIRAILEESDEEEEDQ
jgi:hypothetical protein